MYLYSVLIFFCSENASVHVNARDNLLNVTTAKDATESASVSFRLLGVSFQPITCQCQQSSSDQTFHVRLELKEIIPEDEKCASVDDRVTDTAAVRNEPFYYRCRKCGAVILSRLS